MEDPCVRTACSTILAVLQFADTKVEHKHILTELSERQSLLPHFRCCCYSTIVFYCHSSVHTLCIFCIFCAIHKDTAIFVITQCLL